MTRRQFDPTLVLAVGMSILGCSGDDLRAAGDTETSATTGSSGGESTAPPSTTSTTGQADTSGGGDETATDTGADDPEGVAPSWNEYVGVHYNRRDWAKGGVRHPGGPSTGYRPNERGADEGLEPFHDGALPTLDEILAAGEFAVLPVGGVTPETRGFSSPR